MLTEQNPPSLTSNSEHLARVKSVLGTSLVPVFAREWDFQFFILQMEESRLTEQSVRSVAETPLNRTVRTMSARLAFKAD